MIPMHDVDSGAVIVTVAGGDFVEAVLNRLWMKERKTENASNQKLRQGILILDDILSAS